MPLQVKEYPGYNFIGLIFGLGSETQKRLEKVYPFEGGVASLILVVRLSYPCSIADFVNRKLEPKYKYMVPTCIQDRR